MQMPGIDRYHLFLNQDMDLLVKPFEFQRPGNFQARIKRPSQGLILGVPKFYFLDLRDSSRRVLVVSSTKILALRASTLPKADCRAQRQTLGFL